MESSKRCLQLLPFFLKLHVYFIWLICTTVYPAHPHAHTSTYFTRRFTQKQKLTLNNPIRKVPNSFHDFNDTCFEWIKYISCVTNSMQCDGISKYYICTRNADSFLYTHQLQWRNRVRKCGVELSLQMIYTHKQWGFGNLIDIDSSTQYNSSRFFLWCSNRYHRIKRFSDG